MIKSKSTEPSPSLSLQPQISSTTFNAINNPPVVISPQETAQITARLQQIRPQIPQIDKLLLLHSKLTTPPLNTLEMVKKLTDCRNVLVNQIESTLAKRAFAMNLGQLNLLIEQVQRLFNSLVAKMKESAGVSPALNTTNTKTTVSSGSMSISSSSNNSSSSSISMAKSSKSSKTHSTPTASSSEFEKLLLQRLSLPPDEPQKEFSWLQRYISFNSSRKSSSFKPTNLKHLKQRNCLLNFELKQLQSQTKQVHVQESGLGTLSVLITHKGHRFIFQISHKYPYDQLIYRIEPLQSNSAFVLPRHLEPKTFPLTITTILRNFKE